MPQREQHWSAGTPSWVAVQVCAVSARAAR